MYHHLRGTLYSKSPEEAIIEAGGVGFSVRIPLSTYDALPPEGSVCFIYIEHVTREDEEILFGFSSPHERHMFRLLTSVNRIGPASALAILSSVPVSRLADAIASRDIKFLSSLKGLGKTSAERIVVELAKKVDVITSVPAASAVPLASDAVRALEALGIDKVHASKIVSEILSEISPDLPSPALQDVIVAALRRSQRGA